MWVTHAMRHELQDQDLDELQNEYDYHVPFNQFVYTVE
jgi:hypothetical protein